LVRAGIAGAVRESVTGALVGVGVARTLVRAGVLRALVGASIAEALVGVGIVGALAGMEPEYWLVHRRNNGWCGFRRRDWTLPEHSLKWNRRIGWGVAGEAVGGSVEEVVGRGFVGASVGAGVSGAVRGKWQLWHLGEGGRWQIRGKGGCLIGKKG